MTPQNKPIKAIIIEDEPPARMKLAAFIEKTDSLTLEAVFSDGKSALEYLCDTDERVVFLDIQMEKFTGIQFLEALHNRPKIIITSAYEEYALKGFEYNVCDYLLKPYSYDRFKKAVDKALYEITLERLESRSSQSYILVKTEYRVEKIDLSSILFIEGMKDYIRIHTLSGKIMTLRSMSSIEQELPGDRFMRVHKSYIVALSQINSISKDSVMINGTAVPLGKSYKERFLMAINQKG